MADNMTVAQRSLTMSRIRSRDTKPELTIRRLLHANGLRYRVHVVSLPGKPDIVFSRAKVAVFIDGDFWHGWQFSEWKEKLAPYWRAKIERNMRRDAESCRALKRQGWAVVRLWEHEVRADPGRCVDQIQLAIRPRRTSASTPARRGAEGLTPGDGPASEVELTLAGHEGEQVRALRRRRRLT